MTGASPTLADAAPRTARPAFLDLLWREREPQARADTLPRFAASASDDVDANPEDSAIARRRLALRDALGASQPVTSRESFAGRHDALSRLISAVEQQRVHVVIYGERGIGKTSLAHVFAETAREARYLVLYSSCGTEARFEPMFRAFAAKIPMLYHVSVSPTSAEVEKREFLDSKLGDGPVGPREISDLFAEVVGTRVVIILDEYDRVRDTEFRRDVAELIKNLSDRAARVQLVLTGVAQNLDELIGYAPSIGRNIIGLPMRPMSSAEVRQLLALGERAGEIEYSDEAAKMVETIADGSPYIVRLLAHRAGMAALDQRRGLVTADHAKLAIERVLTDWNAALPRRVQNILAADEARRQWPLLIATARAGVTADGYFTIADVVTEMGGDATAASVERDLQPFTKPGSLFELHDGPIERRYRFRYPGVSALLLMSAAMAKLAV